MAINTMIIFIVVGVFVAVFLIPYLVFNWWRPFTRIKTNGRQFLIQRMNIFFIWQDYMPFGSLASADYVCSNIMKDWRDKQRKYRFVTDAEIGTNRAEQASKE